MSFTFLDALIVGVIYYLAYCEMTIPFIGAGIQDPAAVGMLIGLAYGDMKTGLIIGATIGMLYFSGMQVGGNLPADSVLAACITIPIAIKFNIPQETAMAFAVPFGVLGTFVDNARRLINGMWNRRAQEHVKAGQINKMWIDAILGPSVVSAVLRIVPLTLLLWLFGDMAGSVVSNLPEWLNNGFAVVSGMLPGLGLILCVQFIGKKELLPYFLVGFYAVSLGKFSTVFVAVVGICLAFMHTRFTAGQFEEDYDEEDEDEEEIAEETESAMYGPHSAFTSRGNLWAWCAKFCALFRISHCLEYFYGTGVGFTMLKPLKRVYGENKEGLKTALLRQLKPYISNHAWGMELLTVSLAMEQDIAEHGDTDGTKGEAIESFKTGLMGPMAGLGDSIEGSIVMPLCKAICYPFAMAGNIFGGFTFSLWFGWQVIVSMVTGTIGYEQGRKGITKLLDSPAISKVLYGAGILGIIMMGAMCASYVSFDLAIGWTTSLGSEFSLAALLNGLIPNFCTLLYLGICYILMNKGVSFTKILIGVVVFGLLGSLIGIV